jgi:hypothetical protein
MLIAASVTPRMELLRERGETKTPQYAQLHKQASMLYVAETAMLLVAGVLLPRAMARQAVAATTLTGPAASEPTMTPLNPRAPAEPEVAQPPAGETIAR